MRWGILLFFNEGVIMNSFYKRLFCKSLFCKFILLVLFIPMMSVCMEENPEHEQVPAPDRPQMPATLTIDTYNAERDDKALEHIVNYWEQDGDSLETNWWTVKRYRLTPENIVDVARCDEKTIGFTSYWSSLTMPRVEQGRSLLELWALDPAYKGKGYGKALLLHTINRLRADGMKYIEIHVPSKNLAILQIYQREGFEHTGKFASAGCILPILRLDLTKTSEFKE